MAHAIDRQAIVDSLWAGRTSVPAGLQWAFYDNMFVQGWTVPDFDPAKARELLKAAGYKGDPIPYRLLNNYYTNQVPNAQVLVEMWQRGRAERRDRHEGELVADLRAWPTRAASMTGPTAPPSTTRYPRSSASTARTASSSNTANGPMPR